MIHIRLVFLFLFIAYQLYPLVSYVMPSKEVKDDYLHKKKFSHLISDVHRILTEHNTYYRKLSKQGQQKFMSRVLHLLQSKKFVGYHDLQVTFEMRVLVLSAHVQLTYGFRRFSMSMFKRYILYPEQFYSKYFESDLKGLTGQGFITLSWKDTLQGFQKEDDNLNLALHEMTHAMVINFHQHAQDDLSISRMFAEKDEHFEEKFIELNKSRHTEQYLRDYAFTNKNEFIAVCIEHFFETPREFHTRMPNLYRTICVLLKQNPLNVTNDYRNL
jgi:Mlc titration factor MtfA (ptsG expression regulator)